LSSARMRHEGQRRATRPQGKFEGKFGYESFQSP
jgi:hypothetical protein